MVIQKNFNLLESVVFAISTALGFGLALILFSGIREQLSMVKLPKGMEGIPIALLTAGLLAGIYGFCRNSKIIDYCFF